MSIYVTSRAWKLSNQTGAKLLMILALSDRSDEDGICWPGVEYIARNARVHHRHIQRMLREVEGDGELYVERRAGRKNTNRYFVVIGLEKASIVKILSTRFGLTPLEANAIAESLLERQKKGALEDTISEPKNGDISGEKGDSQGTNGDIRAGNGDIFEREKVTHESPDPSVNPSAEDPSEDPSAEEAEARADSAATPASEIWSALREAGIGPNNRVKALLEKPYLTPGYIRAHFLELVRQQKYSPGLLLTILETGAPAPAIPEDRQPEPGDQKPIPDPALPVARDPSVHLVANGTKTALAAWEAAKSQLEGEMPRCSFQSYVQPAELVRFEPDQNCFRVQAPNAFARDWLDARLSSTTTRMLSGICGRLASVVFVTGDKP